MGEFTSKDYKLGDPEWREKDKPALDTLFPNLPYLKTQDFGVITESGAILRFLGRKHGLAGSDKEALQAEILAGVIGDAWRGMIKVFFAGAEGYAAKKSEEHKKLCDGAWAKISQHLGKNKFIAGDNMTWADFQAAHFFYMWSLWSSQFAEMDNIQRYLSDVKNSKPELAAYWDAECKDRPAFPGFAPWGAAPPAELQAEF